MFKVVPSGYDSSPNTFFLKDDKGKILNTAVMNLDAAEDAAQNADYPKYKLGGDYALDADHTSGRIAVWIRYDIGYVGFLVGLRGHYTPYQVFKSSAGCTGVLMLGGTLSSLQEEVPCY